MHTLINKLQFMLVSMVLYYEDDQKTKETLDEVKSLIHTFGGEVVDVVTQNASRSDKSTYIGKGKARELAERVLEKNIDVVVVNHNLKSSQLYALKQIVGERKPELLVWDRTDLILQIFDKHASSAEAKLQIRLADIHHKGPELFGVGLSMSQQGGGIGNRGGAGETISEIIRRQWRSGIREIEQQLEKSMSVRRQQMNNRNISGKPTISIIGYTNAGKTTLFNLMSKKNNLTKDALFATLDSSVGEVYLPRLKRSAYVTDTIGFIQNLPTQTINAFKSTLMETVNADLLLHVIDLSDRQMLDKIAVVEDVLAKLGIDTKKQVYVFNKIDNAGHIDKIDLKRRFADFTPQFVSAITGEGYEKLRDRIQDVLG